MKLIKNSRLHFIKEIKEFPHKNDGAPDRNNKTSINTNKIN
jgi:hypothetical protein